MQIAYKGEELRVDWTHYMEEGASFCHLYRVRGGKREGVNWGYALLDPGQVLPKEKRRQISLLSLMYNLGLTKEERREWWTIYAIQTNKGWLDKILKVLISTLKKTLSLVPSAG
jgi:hypothetical protein